MIRLKTEPRRPGLLRRAVRWLLFVGLGGVLLLLALWAAAALYFDVTVASLRIPLAVGYLLMLVGAVKLVRNQWLRAALPAIGFAIVFVWWLTLKPSNQRDWAPDVATLAYAEIDGSKVTVRNIRNCDYRTETDFDVRHYDKTFDLERLRTADLYMVYWGSPNMAHTMVSFGFEGGDYLCFSIETRKEKGESYSAVRGLFRQFELVYIAADERDVVRLRTNFRKGEDAYLFRLNAPTSKVRELFLNYLNRLNSLRETPEWYNAVADNCTTSIRNQRAAAARAPWDWRMLVNGRGDQLLYERGAIHTDLPLAELKQRALINDRARQADKDSEFSQLIRKGVPGVEP